MRRVAAFLDAVRRSRSLHGRWAHPPSTVDEYRAFVERVRGPSHLGQVVCTEDGSLAGVININEIVRGSFCSGYLGYYALAPHDGRGYMREGLKAVIRLAFRTHGLHRLEANIQPGNVRSIALVRGLGVPARGLLAEVPEGGRPLARPRTVGVDCRESQPDMSPEAPSQFYTGLVADLYDPLAAARSRADDYIPFLTRSGTPALRARLRIRHAAVELVERGYEVEGLDASRDMLERCRVRASERGVNVTVHFAEMQSFSLPRLYRSIFIAGGSFTLLTTDDDAARSLACIHAQLAPGGSVLIRSTATTSSRVAPSSGSAREATTESGQRLRVTLVAVDASADNRNVRHTASLRAHLLDR